MSRLGIKLIETDGNLRIELQNIYAWTKTTKSLDYSTNKCLSYHYNIFIQAKNLKKKTFASIGLC